MKIVIEPVGHRYVGKLYLNDEEIATHSDVRPGCCARALMNQMLLTYGKPESTLTINITGW